MRYSYPVMILLLVAPVRADEGASFLKIGVGARATGTGAAQTALVDDAAAIYWNPAGLASVGRTEMAAHHADLFADTRYDFAAFARPTPFGTVGAGFGFLSQGALEGRDENRQATGSFSASDSVFGLALARKVSSTVRLGLGLKGIQSRIAGDSAATAAVDAGVIWKSETSPATLGGAVTNLGPGLRFIGERSELPLTLALGAGFNVLPGLALAADARFRPYSHTQEYGFGTEYSLMGALTLRGGWLGSRTQGGSSPKDRAYLPQGFAAGIGLRVYSFNLDYSFQPYGELGNAHRISIAARFH